MKFVPVVLLMAVVAQPCAAQYESSPGSRLRAPKPADIVLSPMNKSDQTRLVIAEFGECVVRSSPAAARGIAELFPSDPALKKLFDRAANSDCLRGGDLTMSYQVMRGAIFIGLYRKDYGAVAPAIPIGKVDYGQGGQHDSADDKQKIALLEFGDCAFRSDPIDSRAIILSRPGTSQETNAYTGLAPHLNECLTSGLTINFSKAFLAGLIAEVAYRSALAAQLNGAH